ncbi:hypothetical protein [Butyrivibrio sp. AE3009]|nr:hypothetical protein [Butyrivibrio sp. AE3009]
MPHPPWLRSVEKNTYLSLYPNFGSISGFVRLDEEDCRKIYEMMV